MGINATLIGQFITFAIFIWFTAKFIWPKILTTVSERQKKISEGLEAALRGQRKLESAERQCKNIIAEAKLQGSHIIERANERAAELIETAKTKARQESRLLLDSAHVEIAQQIHQAKMVLQDRLAELVILGVEKILKHEVNATVHETTFSELITDWKEKSD